MLMPMIVTDRAFQQYSIIYGRTCIYKNTQAEKQPLIKKPTIMLRRISNSCHTAGYGRSRHRAY